MIKLKDIALDNVAKMSGGELDQLPHFTPSGLPVYYIVDTPQICCPNCANNAEVRQDLFNNGDWIADLSINYGYIDLYCDFCEKKVKSARGCISKYIK